MFNQGVFNQGVTPTPRAVRRLTAVPVRLTRRIVAAGLALAITVSGCGTGEDTPPLPGERRNTPVVGNSATPPERLGDVLVARYTFDDGLADGQVSDASGNHLALQAVTADGGTVDQLPRGGGLAVRFPTPCQPSAQHRCPRAILETVGGTALNPVGERLRFGASLRLARTETSTGSNVLQKGFATGGSQWKLQIDGADGRPSCVVVGVVRPRIHLVVADASIADDKWHAVACDRHGTAFTITVDGVERGRVTVPADLTIANEYPVRIGGNSANQRNDQYFGALDDAFIAIG